MMESWMQSWQPRANAFCSFSSPCLWSIAPATKKWCQVIQSAAPVTQNHLPETEDLMLQNATSLRKSAPWPPNISDEHVSFTAPATENASFQILFKCPTPANVFGHARKPPRFAHFWQGAQSLVPATQNHICTFSTSQVPKVLRPWCPLYMLWNLTWKCSSRHNGVHFFDISTSKSAPTLVCLYILTWKCASRHNGVHFFESQLPKVLRPSCVLYILTWKCASRHISKSAPTLVSFVRVVEFDLEMCFGPQRRALFRHLNFQKCSDPGVFVHFDLEMCFAPQRRALFRHHNFQKCSPTLVCFVHVDYFDLEMCFAPHWRAIFAFLIWPHGSAPAALASLLFDPPEPQIAGKTQCFATLLPFRAPASSFFSLFPFSDLLSSALLFSDASHLCFSICPYCWKFDF